MAVDGAGNVWAGMGYPVNSVTTGSTTANTYALAEVDNTLTIGLSPNGSAPSTCTSSACYTLGGFQKTGLGTSQGLAVDPTGNVWATSISGTTYSLVEIVGAAVPVVTPLAAAAANGTLATKP